VAAASAAFFLLGLGEELWKKFLPKYVEARADGDLSFFTFILDFDLIAPNFLIERARAAPYR
jgi:hypothetical protein